MPFVTISLHEGKNNSFIKSLSDIIHTAMVETIVFPSEVLFHKIHELKKGKMIYLPEFRNIKRSDDIIFIECTIKSGRTAEQKEAMFGRISEDLHAKLNIRNEDVVIVVRENSAEDWHLNPS